MDRLVIFCLLSVINTETDITKPCGPVMCVQICSKVGWCDFPRFNEIHLICSTITIEHRQMRDFVTLSSNADRDNKTERIPQVIFGEYHILAARRGFDVRIPRKIDHLDTDEGPAKILKDEDPLAPIHEGLPCYILSMTNSWKYDHVILILLQCQIGQYFRRLAFIDKHTRQFLNHTINFREREENERKIFVGACSKTRSASCLYSINLGMSLLITSYEEPTLATTMLKRENRMKKQSYFATFICSSFAKTEILCLSGVSFWRIVSRKGVLRLKFYNWVIKSSVTSCKDFKLLDASMNPQILILRDDVVQIIRLYMESKMHYFIKCMNVDRHIRSVGWVGDLLMLSSYNGTPSFYLCQKEDFYSCREKKI